MSQLLQTPDNITWLGKANKYIENQWSLQKNWDSYEMVQNKDFDNQFLTEFDFVVGEIKTS
jgi:hypothetical protein